MLHNQGVGRPRVHQTLTALARATGGRIVRGYDGRADILALWGFGGHEQREAFKKHRASGRHVVCLDLGYWDRHAYGVRVTVDSWHPQESDLELTKEPRPGYVVPGYDENFYNPQGHIVLCGIGKKSRRLLGFNGMQWEHEQLRILREIYPERRIVYRPKPGNEEAMPGAGNGSSGSIIDCLRGASMAICLHSNVAIDCALLGIPCVSYDGIGQHGFRGATPAAPIRLTGAARARFLNSVAWFNWQAAEFSEMVKFIEKIIEAKK